MAQALTPRTIPLRAANSPLSPQAQLALDLFFAEEMGGCTTRGWRNRGRDAEFARLHALPDAALSAMGLQRDGLARYLFHDILRR